MDSGSVLSEPVHYPHSRGFTKERSSSMVTIISPKPGQPRMSQLENLEAKMANIEVSLSSSNGGRRRKGTSLGGGTISARSSPRPPPTPQPIESKELRTALQDREAVIQNLRNVLCLGKLPRPTGPPLDDSERPAAEQKLQRLKIESDNKKIAIRNLKSALDKLDITDNIDIRIRQAELEYALGREELQLLSIVEEARALQTRLDKSKPESNTLYSLITSGLSLSLHAVQATTGRWAANTKSDSLGLFIEWALDGEGLYRGDRILEINGKLLMCRTKDELQKLVGTVGKCQLVIIRKRSAAIQHQQLSQQQEDNQRLQHRISYLEEQVRELLQQQTKESTPPPQQQQQHQQPQISPINNNGNNCGNGLSGHVTSISISSPPSSPSDKPEIFQRGNYVTTLVGGKPIELTGNNNSTVIKNGTNSNVTTPAASITATPSKSHITKTIIKENGNHTDGENNYAISKSLSASKISINSDLLLSSISSSSSSNHKRRTADRTARNNKLHSENINYQYQQQQQQQINNSQGIYHNGNGVNHRNNMHARSVEHLNYNGIERRSNTKFDILRNNNNEQIRKFGNDLRSVKSLDFESDNDNNNNNNHYNHYYNQNGHSNHNNNHYNNHNNNHNSNHHNHNNYHQQKRNTDYTSEPVAPRIRPTPPKKPLRLSLQRAQSLQTVELIPPNDMEKKRSLKRIHHSDKSNHESALIENCTPLLTASLGRHKHI